MFQALIFSMILHAFVAQAESTKTIQGVPNAGRFIPLDEKLEGPASIYTPEIVRLIRQWPPKGLDDSFKSDENPVKLQCIETPGNPYYIGLRQQMRVDAPLSRVEAILDDIDRYQHLFPGYDDIHIVSSSGNKFLTFWEQHIPVFFVPNVKYQVTYLMDKSSPHLKVYRYQLKESEHLKASDGLIVIESETDPKTLVQRTRYTEFDFFDADWGILKTLAPEKIWKESVEGIYLSDLAIKLKAEHPEWDSREISEKGRKLLEANPVEKFIQSKKIWGGEL
jgi:hypothetical protein